jgi:hypothetical protein
VVHEFDGDEAVLRVGPGNVAVRVDAGALPEGATVGTWLVMDVQAVPPIPLVIDHELTRARRDHDA